MKDSCSNCYKKDDECECTLEKMVGGEGFCQSTKFGIDSLTYSIVKMDKKLVLKIKLWNDFIYLDSSGIEFLNGITSRYIEVKQRMYQRELKD